MLTTLSVIITFVALVRALCCRCMLPSCYMQQSKKSVVNLRFKSIERAWTIAYFWLVQYQTLDTQMSLSYLNIKELDAAATHITNLKKKYRYSFLVHLYMKLIWIVSMTLHTHTQIHTHRDTHTHIYICQIKSIDTTCRMTSLFILYFAIRLQLTY